MRARFSLLNLFSGVIAASSALLIIVALLAVSPTAEILGALMLQLVLVTVALAVLIGLLNLTSVQLGRLNRNERGWLNGLVVLVAAAAVIVIHISGLHASDDANLRLSDLIFSALQIALASALAGMIFFFLVYAAYRMLREKISLGALVFIISLLIVLLGSLPMSGLGAFTTLQDWLTKVPATAGGRGLLIGLALGTITVGLRTLIGQEKVYRD